MKTIFIILLTACSLGCGGYGSGSGSGSMAAGAPHVVAPLVPNTATAGSTAFTLTVNGSGFVAQSVVYWNSTAHTTTFVTSSQLTAAISAADVANAGAVPVFVKNPGGTGIYNNQPAQNSNMVNFTVQ
jgi:IPT/TIG domain